MKLFLKGRLLRLIGIAAGAGSRLGLRAARTARHGVVIGDDCDLHCRFSIDRAGAVITVGNRCFIGASHIVSADRVAIGDDVTISWGVTIVDHNSHALDWERRKNDTRDWAAGTKDWTDISMKAVKIERRVWIGFNASILKGVTIGEGAIIGACSVVTHDVAPYTVVAGNPARVIKRLEPPHD